MSGNDVRDQQEEAPPEVEADVEDQVVAEEGLGAPSLAAALEAVLMVAEAPLPTAELAALVRTPQDEVLATLQDLAQEYAVQGRGFDLRELGGGWRFWTRDNCAGVVERYVLDGQHARLSQAALETLAVVAYRQPVTRARISAIRGVNVDGVVRTLVTRGFVEESGHDGVTGAVLLRTTPYFLERMGLNALEDLPPIAEHLPMPDSVEEVLDFE